MNSDLVGYCVISLFALRIERLCTTIFGELNGCPIGVKSL